MSPVFAARRRAEEFDSLVEGASTGSVDDARYASLLELVGALRETPPVEARPAFVADLREQLMAAAETELAVSAAGARGDKVAAPVHDLLTVPRRSPRERRLATVVGGFAIVGATTSMAVASQSALPGDVLYPIKRAMENARTGFSVDDGQKGSTLLVNATGRLDEVGELATSQETQDVRAIEETLATFTDQATEASDLLLAAYEADPDPAAISELQAFTEQSFATLGDLAAVVPDEVRDSLVSAGNVLAGIEAAVQLVCPSCQDVLTEMPQWLLPTSATSGLQDLLPGLPQAAPAAVETPGDGGGKKEGKGDGRPDGPRGDGAGKPGTGGTTPPTTPQQPTGGGTSGQPPATGGAQTGGGTTAPPEQKPDPVGDLIDAVVSGGKGDGTKGTKGGTSTPTTSPSLDDMVDDVLEGVGGLVDGITKPLP